MVCDIIHKFSLVFLSFITLIIIDSNIVVLLSTLHLKQFSIKVYIPVTNSCSLLNLFHYNDNRCRHKAILSLLK